MGKGGNKTRRAAYLHSRGQPGVGEPELRKRMSWIKVFCHFSKRSLYMPQEKRHMVVYAYNPGTQEAKAGLFKVSDQPGMHSEFQLIFGYKVLKKKKNKTENPSSTRCNWKWA